ncbi:hypothetical protein EV702DRAFT_1202346 [Suillus placidus]|uniref:Uncharacterized protein n=1 Tax=Suillus placidus TaxID=48579 RepID=A0A9P6ZKZ4_9AGAM|nr:hypothetical protein EV702DRAFT_1202346 [Suillus placidus]
MPSVQHDEGEDFTREINNVDSNSTSLDDSDGTDSPSDSDSSNDADFLQIWDAIVAPAINASTQDLRKVLEVTQELLLNMRGKHRETLKKVALLEATVSKGQKTKLTNKDLALAGKEDSIRNFGHKFSITHCLWVETSIFPLRGPPPRIDLTSKECWLSLLSIQDGIKAKLFQFIPPADHNMMAHKNFASHFVKGVNNVCAEMLSDVKSWSPQFFNNSLFATSSSSATLLDSDSLVGKLTRGSHDSWEEMFEHAMETGGELPELDAPGGPVIEAPPLAPPPTPPPTPPPAPPAAPPTAPQSISAAMQNLALAEDRHWDPPPVAVDEDEPEPPVVLEAPVAAQKSKPKPKPKPRRKGKADTTNTDISEDRAPASFKPEVSLSAAVSDSGV